MRAARYVARLAAILLVLALAAGFMPAASMPARAVSPNVVISQVYGGGGNSGATYTNDFIELFNRGDTAVSLAGWSVQYASATGTGNFGASSTQLTELPSITLAPGQYLLIQEAQGTAGTVGLPTPDVTDPSPIAMSGTSGKVALVSSASSLGCNGGSSTCSPEQLAQIVDLVGYGSANFFEGSPAPALSNTTAAIRANGGCTDTDNNADDFATGDPDPRNTASPSNLCSALPTDTAPAVDSTSPASGAADVELDANITVTFNEAVDAGDGWFAISCDNGGTYAATVAGGPTEFTLDPDGDLLAADRCTVTINRALVTDQDSDDPPDAMAADYAWSFTTLGPRTYIHDIQGAGHVSPLAGQTVSNVQGIVTAVRSTGFYMQELSADWDGDDATSEGIFVYKTRDLPAVGEVVRVSGKVSEYRYGGINGTNLATTELSSSVNVTVLPEESGLPAPVVIGTDRVPPSTIIENDATDSVETSGEFDPAEDGIDFWESLEGMLVELDNPVAVGPTNPYHELPVVYPGATMRTPRGGIVIRPDDYNPERVVLASELSGGPEMPMVNVGDSFAGPVVGVVDFDYGNFWIEVTELPAVVPGGLTREVTAPADTDELAVAAFNVENLAPTDPPSKFETLAGLIVNNLQAPDILAVEEIQDSTGARDDGVVEASATYSMLIDAIQAAGGPVYDYRQIDPVNDEDGGAPGGNIRQGFLFRTDRGLGFVDRPGGDATTATAVVSGPAGPELSASPGRIDPTNDAFFDSRKPLAGEFVYNGHKLFVVANHFNSKGGDQPLFGRFQPPAFSSEVQRIHQAQVVHDFVQSILDMDADADVIVLGDLNDFQFSNPIVTLKGDILKDLIDTLPENERYSYVYDGNSETLDHILVSNHLFESTPYAYDVVHVNAEFVDQASDHDPQVVRLTLSPTAGFVTGGGWLDTADGKAEFELACKYVSGMGAPTGEFEFTLPGLSFQGTGFRWLVTSGNAAECQGTGTIAGREGTFEFTVGAVAGDTPGKGVDQLRVVIRGSGGLVYDTGAMALGGGNITVHR